MVFNMNSPHSPHAQDLRKGRFSQANQAYLLTSVTEERQKWFSDFFIGRIVVDCMRQQQMLGQVESLAFVVMPDHFHWLLVLQDGASLSAVMRVVKGRSAHAIGQCHQRPVHSKFWQDGFHDHALRKDEDIKAAARYIVANPLRAGLVSRIGDYPLWDAKWLSCE